MKKVLDDWKSNKKSPSVDKSTIPSHLKSTIDNWNGRDGDVIKAGFEKSVAVKILFIVWCYLYNRNNIYLHPTKYKVRSHGFLTISCVCELFACDCNLYCIQNDLNWWFI